ncbi:hypothetical protein [Winogradskyella sp.]|uniref:hypothetical protein n=1 Tax=Winogradskyella sp. TaxID=1883156 RepID=UPI00351485F9
MKIGLVLLSIFSFLMLSCGEGESQSQTINTEVENQQTPITAKAIENFNYSDYALSSEAEEAIVSWKKYQELAIQIGYLKKADLSFFNGDQKLLKKFIDEFKAQIPVELRTNPITSRTIIIETTLLRLNENLTLDNIDSNLKLESVKEVLVAFSNLNYQINKKLVRDRNEKIMPQY